MESCFDEQIDGEDSDISITQPYKTIIASRITIRIDKIRFYMNNKAIKPVLEYCEPP